VLRLAQRVQPERLVILTDEPGRLDLGPLAAFHPVEWGVDSDNSWRWLRTCRRLAIPLGHAADWWAAWLSDAEEIYVCDPWGPGVESPCQGEYGCGWLGGRPLGRPDLRVNEPRWIYDW
jgi:hypothetical protein